MRIERTIISELLRWKDSSSRKPLILQGARQVGKTWLLEEFGRLHFDDTAVFNFDENEDLESLFAATKDVQRIIQHLEIVHQKPIVPERTLIVFDEIQECNQALNSLKYFCEKAPEYCVACAGSLLGVAMNRGASFPVGKVDFLTVHPLSFLEFLRASDNMLFDYLMSIQTVEQIPDLFFNRLVEKFKMFFISGGMPAAVSALLGEGDVGKVQAILQGILQSYALDFSKHAENRDVNKIGYIWESLPSQLARENKKFLYQTVKPGARAREYEDALLWLKQAGLIYQVYRTTKPAIPVKAYDDLSAFKVYAMDVGILRKLAGLLPTAMIEGNRLLTEFKGGLTENYVLQSLVNQFEVMPRYWTSGSKAEVDFVLQADNDIIPVEVKSDENVTSRSLSIYRKEHSPKLSIRYSLRNFKQEAGLLNIPLFLVDRTVDFLQN